MMREQSPFEMEQEYTESVASERSPEKRWEEMDGRLLPQTIPGTTFTIPYEPITVRQLITRAEFAREENEEQDPLKYVGRKINRKAFTHPLSGKEYLVIKANRGGATPHLFISPESQQARGELDIDNLQIPREIKASQVSRVGALLEDERTVRLARMVEGSNRKGKEHQTQYYLQYDTAGKPHIDVVHRENAKPHDISKKGEFATQGVVLERRHPLAETVLYVKSQSPEWENDTFLFAALYEQGTLQNTMVRRIPLTDLPVFEETMREDPSILARALRATPPTGETAEGTDFSFPEHLDQNALLEALLTKEPLAISGKGIIKTKKGDSNAFSPAEIHVDPEADQDLNRAIEQLRNAFGPALQEIYFYGSIPRGYKHLQSDIDILAVVDDDVELLRPLNGFESPPDVKKGQLMYDALGSYAAQSKLYPFRRVELHTIHAKDFKKQNNKRLGEFLRNISDEWIEIWRREAAS